MADVGDRPLAVNGFGERIERIAADRHPGAALDWESIWTPYDEETYRAVLEAVQPDDVVLDIGAGDLRLARRLPTVARNVYAVERQADVLRRAWNGQPGQPQGLPLRDNLTIICADARTWPFPAGLTAGVLLMRHCRHFGLYVSKLRAAGARKLVTNARWGMGVEVIDLRPGLAWQLAATTPGWYACVCGAVGFVQGPSDMVLDIEHVKQVEECEQCVYRGRKSPSSSRKALRTWSSGSR